MPSSTAVVFTVLAGIIALAAGYIYFFGIPPEAKRAMEEKALETMGENKASYMMKGSKRNESLHGQILTTRQTPSARFQPLIRRTSSSSEMVLVTLPVDFCRTLSESRPVTPPTN